MGSSKSSSQANQVSNATSNDNRVLNESGIVAQNSALDLSSYFSADTTNTSNITDNSSMFLSNYDTRDMSTSNNYNDSRSTSSVFTDNSDRSTMFTDSRSTSTSNMFTDARATNTWDSSSAVTGSYNTTTTADPLIAKAAFDFATNNDAMLGDGLDKMLGFASELTGRSTDNATTLASRFQDGLAQAFDSGRNTTPGGIDNKTMIVLGVAAVAGLAYMTKKGS